MEKREESVVYAGFWVRVLASVIDGLILTLPLSIVEALFGDESTITLVLFFVLWWLYTSRMLSSSWKATIGKKIVAIEVVDEQGNQLTFRGASFRFLYSMISYMLILPILMMLFSERKQTLHDKMAKTIVLDSAAMSDGSTYNNTQFIRAIGYILLSILGAAQAYAIGMMIFFYLLISSSSNGNHHSAAIILEDYNTTSMYTNDKNVSIEEKRMKEKKAVDKKEEQPIEKMK